MKNALYHLSMTLQCVTIGAAMALVTILATRALGIPQ